MSVHSAVFKQPGPELNPIGARVSFPICVEVFEVVTGKLAKRLGWTAREATSKSTFKQVGITNSPYEARYRVANLFEFQLEPWKVDGQRDEWATYAHFHHDVQEPSICGNRYHQSTSERFEPAARALSLPMLRAGRRILVPEEWRNVCQVCASLIDRTPMPGDRVRVRVSRKTGIVIALADPEMKAGTVRRYILQYDDPQAAESDPAVWTAPELVLTMFDGDPRT
jgi:hypothetical protein